MGSVVLNSLSSRVIALGVMVAGALMALVALLLDASVQTRASFAWVAHTEEVIQTLDETMADLREVESGQRGFLLTRNPAFARTVDERIFDTARGVVRLQQLTRDNPVQSRRAARLRSAVAERLKALRGPLALGRAGRFEAAIATVADGHGRDLMDAVVVHAQEMIEEERALLADRAAAADSRLRWNRGVVVVGVGGILALIALMVFLLTRGIRRPMHAIIAAMTALGGGDRKARVEAATGSTEFDRLAGGYNAMADRLEAAVAGQIDSDERLQAANLELQRNSDVLAARGNIIELLGGMAHRMQAARTDEELAAIIRCFAPRVLPGIPGLLYAHNNSRNLLIPIAGWGGAEPTDGFAPDECWSLRRGQGHFITEPGTDIVCAHVHDEEAIYHCEPLLAGGEVIGMLHLHGVVGPENRFRLTALAENIASALVNHRLQRGLREQTIRDPLTGLFNRRYMEEALALEIARATRSGAPLSLVMCDVDHFKRFNDDFGHDAGDAVLQAVSAEMGRYFRDGDVVCRYGGEEFTIIAPGATPEQLAERIEELRVAMTELSVRQGGRQLGAISMSFGIAGWDHRMARDGSALVRLADTGLYRAKQEGRNRTVVEMRQAA